jgi:hypothetical protein
MDHDHAVGREIRIAGDDDIRPARQRLADGIVADAAHDDRLADGERLEAFEVRREPPRQSAVATDDMIPGDGDDERNLHRQTATGALMVWSAS